MAALTPAQIAEKKVALDIQIADTNKKISDLAKATIVAKAPTPDTYFEATNQTKVDDAPIQEFSAVYKPIYEKYKGINMTTGGAANQPEQKAFYTFDPSSEAAREADQTITRQTGQHQDYLDQQATITQWINQQQGLYSNQLFDRFFNDMLGQQHPALLKNQITASSPFFDMNKWNKTAPKDRGAYSYGGGYGKAPTRSYWYISPDDAKRETDILKSVYQDKFNNDAKIQEKYRASFLNELQKTLVSLQKERQKLG